MWLGIVIVGSILLLILLGILVKLPAIIEAPLSTWLNVIGLGGATIIPILIFFIPGYYKGIAVLMYEGFPFLQISLVVAVLSVLWVTTRGRILIETQEIDEIAWLGILNGLWVSGLGVLLAGPLVGKNTASPSFSVGGELLGEFMQLFYVPGLWLLHVVLVLLFTIQLPFFIAGMIHLSLRHPAEETVKQSVKRTRPDHLVEQDLAAILKSQHVKSEELQALWHELSPLKRWLWRIQFSLHARKSADLASIAKAAMDAHRKDTELGKTVHEMERARRKRG